MIPILGFSLCFFSLIFSVPISAPKTVCVAWFESLWGGAVEWAVVASLDGAV